MLFSATSLACTLITFGTVSHDALSIAAWIKGCSKFYIYFKLLGSVTKFHLVQKKFFIILWLFEIAMKDRFLYFWLFWLQWYCLGNGWGYLSLGLWLRSIWRIIIDFFIELVLNYTGILKSNVMRTICLDISKFKTLQQSFKLLYQ